MPEILILIYAFIVGTLFGSFSTAISWRTIDIKLRDKREKDIAKKIHKNIKITPKIQIEKDEIHKNRRYSIWNGRSMCPHCRTTLPWWALVPVFSYIVLRGKCHNCKVHISIVYPLAELSCGLFFLFMMKGFFESRFDIYQLVLLVIVFVALMVLSLQDIWFEEISDKVAIPVFVFAFIYQIIYSVYINNFGYLLNAILTTVGCVVIFGLLVMFTNAMGGGDIRIFAIISICLGFPATLVALTIAFLVASIGGVTFAVVNKQKNILKYHIRLIPYLALGFGILAIWSNIILSFLFG